MQLKHFRKERPGGLSEGNVGIDANAQMTTRLIHRHGVIDEASEKLLETAITRMGLARPYVLGVRGRT